MSNSQIKLANGLKTYDRTSRRPSIKLESAPDTSQATFKLYCVTRNEGQDPIETYQDMFCAEGKPKFVLKHFSIDYLRGGAAPGANYFHYVQKL